MADISSDTAVATGGTTARTAANHFADALSVLDFGAAVDGSTNDLAAFKAAIAAAAAGILVVPKGTMRLVIDSDQEIVIPAGATIRGAGIGATTIKLDYTGSGAHSALVPNGNNIAIEDLKIDCVVPAGATKIVFRPKGIGFFLRRVEIDGNISIVSGPDQSHILPVITLKNDCSEIYLEECYIHHCSRTFLKTSSDQTDNKNIYIHNCRFENNFRIDLSFNTPHTNSSITTVRIVSCFFKDNQGEASGAPADKYFIGMASAKDVIVAFCRFEGTGAVCVHVEEAASQIAVVHNTALNNGGFFFCVDNNIGGSSATPRAISVIGNICTRADSAADIGIELANNGGVPPAEDVLVEGNYLENYEKGINGQYEEGLNVRIVRNLLKNNEIGIRAAVRGSATWRDNQFDGNTIDLDCEHNTSFHSCVFVGTPTFQKDPTTCQFISLVDARWEFPETSVPASSTVNLTLVSSVQRISGHMIDQFSVGGSAYNNSRRSAEYNGSTLTSSVTQDFKVGAIATSTVISSQNWIYRLTNAGAAVTAHSIVVDMQGLIIV